MISNLDDGGCRVLHNIHNCSCMDPCMSCMNCNDMVFTVLYFGSKFSLHLQILQAFLRHPLHPHRLCTWLHRQSSSRDSWYGNWKTETWKRSMLSNRILRLFKQRKTRVIFLRVQECGDNSRLLHFLGLLHPHHLQEAGRWNTNVNIHEESSTTKLVQLKPTWSKYDDMMCILYIPITIYIYYILYDVSIILTIKRRCRFGGDGHVHCRGFDPAARGIALGPNLNEKKTSER